MPSVFLSREASLLAVIDVQEGFLDSIWEGQRVLRRACFLLEVANLLGIPTLATAQNPNRLGSLHPEIAARAGMAVEKMSFSCWGDESFREAVQASGRSQVVMVGVETHICIGLTTQDLMAAGHEVAVCPDGVSSSDVERHKLGMERIRDAGAVPIHSEAVAYEWIQAASEPKFREMLRLVKRAR